MRWGTSLNRIGWVVATVLALTSALAACSGTAETYDLEASEWVLASLNGERPLEGTRITLEFEPEQISGFAGCNSYGALYKIEGDALAIQEIEITLIACVQPEGVMAQETAYLDALREAANLRVSDERLELLNDSDEVTLAYTREAESAIPPAKLAGTQWRLLSLNEHDLVAGSTIKIAFMEDGMSGHAGCRDYHGSYQARGDDIRFPFIEMIETGCDLTDELLHQEGEYTDALTRASDYRLGEETLEIFTAPGGVLVFELD